MKLDNQVCSLELAKRLKELLIKQNSLFCYVYYQAMNVAGYILEPIKGQDNYFSAFTVAELGEMLPKYITTMRENNEYGCYLNEGINLYSERDKLEANARGKMLIYLLEKGLIENATS